jgi:hypothetical protein
VIYPGSTPVGNATLGVANVLTCNKLSHCAMQHGVQKIKDKVETCMVACMVALGSTTFQHTTSCQWAEP